VSGRLGQQPALDGVRAIAIAFVVLYHADEVVRATDHDFSGGFLGVDLFFVLSGFLITRLLLEERAQTDRVSIRRFYGRRATRLLPALGLYLVAQAVWMATGNIAMSVSREAKGLLAVVLYVGNWSHTFGRVMPPGLGHLWSLGVEEQFYAVWPIAFLLTARHPRRLAVVIVGGIATAVLLRWHLYSGPVTWRDAYFRTDARMDPLLIGAGLALAHASGHLARVPDRLRRIGAVVGLVGLGIGVLTLHIDDAVLYDRGLLTGIALAGALLISGVVDQRWWLTRALGSRVPRAIGRVSYGLYLWHLLVLFWVSSSLQGLGTWETLGLSAVLTAVAVTASWFLVERPVLRWGHRRFARPGSAAAQGATSDQSSGRPPAPGPTRG
jgi:peptidoglycan/LPS O-acetylase OafA/YrhL